LPRLLADYNLVLRDGRMSTPPNGRAHYQRFLADLAVVSEYTKRALSQRTSLAARHCAASSSPASACWSTALAEGRRDMSTASRLLVAGVPTINREIRSVLMAAAAHDATLLRRNDAKVRATFDTTIRAGGAVARGTGRFDAKRRTCR
jgi:hypothetical protein